MQNLVRTFLEVLDGVAEVSVLGVVEDNLICTGTDGDGLLGGIDRVARDILSGLFIGLVKGPIQYGLFCMQNLVRTFLEVLDGVGDVSSLHIGDLQDIGVSVSGDGFLTGDRTERITVGAVLGLGVGDALTECAGTGVTIGSRIEKIVFVVSGVLVVLNGVSIGFRNPLSGVNNFIGRTADCGSDTGGPAVKSIIFALGRSIWRRRIAFLQVIKRLKNAAIGVFIGYAINLDGRLTNSAFGKFDVSAIQFAALERQIDISVGKNLTSFCIAILQSDPEAHTLLILTDITDIPSQSAIVVRQTIVRRDKVDKVKLICVDNVGHHRASTGINLVGDRLTQLIQNIVQRSSRRTIVKRTAFIIRRRNIL